jgi:hypothetical protein
MFLLFLLKLALATILSTFAFGLSWLPALILTIVSGKRKLHSGVLAIIGGIPFAFCCGAWSAYCAAFAHEHALLHRLGWNWLYFIAAFFFCTLPLSIGFSESVRLQAPLGDKETLKLGLFALCSKWATRTAYLLFGIWPSLAAVPYGWLNHFLF